VKKRANLRP